MNSIPHRRFYGSTAANATEADLDVDAMCEALFEDVAVSGEELAGIIASPEHSVVEALQLMRAPRLSEYDDDLPHAA